MSATTLATAALFPRRELAGTFGTPVRSDGWHQTDIEGQSAARELAELGATGVYVNVFGVAFGVIDGVRVLLSSGSPARYCLLTVTPDCITAQSADAGDDYTYALVTRVDWTVQTGGFLRVIRDADAYASYHSND